MPNLNFAEALGKLKALRLPDDLKATDARLRRYKLH